MAVRDGAVCVGQVGDGAVVAEIGEDLALVSGPDHGEYVNEVVPLTASTWLEGLRVSSCVGSASAVAVFTDGCERAALRREPGPSGELVPHRGFFLPLFAYGAAVSFLPYYLPGWLAGRMSRRPTDYATIRLLASVVAFPLFWVLETSLVWWAAGPRWALAFFLSLPLGGVIAYRYLVGTGRLRHQVRFGALLLTRAQEARRLLAERREIVEELERAKRDYLGRRERIERLK